MTAQIAEEINIDGERFAMCTEPLADYFELSGKRFNFATNCTALWRGYVGCWEVQKNRLYLVGMSGTLEDGSDVTLAAVFPGFPDRVFAHWFSGTVRLPQGKLLKYRHMGYGSIYESDIFITFDHGVLTQRYTNNNGAAGNEGASNGYQVNAMTVFPNAGGDQR